MIKDSTSKGALLQFVTAFCLSDQSNPVVLSQHKDMLMSKPLEKGFVCIRAQSTDTTDQNSCRNRAPYFSLTEN